MYSVNGRLILEVYKKQALKSEIRGGIAFVGQKVRVEGLRLLMDAKLSDGTIIPAGSKAFIREEVLHNLPNINKPLESSATSEPFLVVDAMNVDFFELLAK